METKNGWNVGVVEKGRKRAADRELLSNTWEQLKDNRSQKDYYIVKKPSTQDRGRESRTGKKRFARQQRQKSEV